jgi:L-cysteine S-thiosulfotransferase
LPADGLCAFHSLYCDGIIEIEARETSLIATFSKPAFVLALLAGTAMAASAQAQSAAEGQKLAFELTGLKAKYSRDELIAIVTDETKRNPQTVMPPFGRNRILSEKEIDAVVDFLQTL